METPKLSTMVVLYSTNLKLNTNLLLEKLPINETIIKIEKKGILRRGESSRDRIKRRARNKKEKTNNSGFGHNSISVVIMNDGGGELLNKEITIKIFQNGLFHMTGILDEKYDSNSINSILNIIWNDHQDCIVEPPPAWEITKRRVVLMNYTTQLIEKRTIAREGFYNTVKSLNDSNVTVSYDPDVYPGVKIQFSPNKWTANVFRTGKIILTGVASREACGTLFENLEFLLQKTLIIK
jgi:TATA-box binding protein (TBP) (component of TFIID and TFIIIB)